jgi:hypothetical protein
VLIVTRIKARICASNASTRIAAFQPLLLNPCSKPCAGSRASESRASGDIHRDGAVSAAGTAHTMACHACVLSDPNQSALCDCGSLLRPTTGSSCGHSWADAHRDSAPAPTYLGRCAGCAEVPPQFYRCRQHERDNSEADDAAAYACQSACGACGTCGRGRRSQRPSETTYARANAGRRRARVSRWLPYGLYIWPRCVV